MWRKISRTRHVSRPRRAGHKVECGEGTPNDLLLKLAERALAVPKIVEHLWMLSIVTLDLLKDIKHADRFAIQAQCGHEPVDVMAYMRRLMDGHERDDNAQISLNYLQFTRVPLNEVPERVRSAHKSAKEKLAKERRDADGMPTAKDAPVVAYYFVTEEDATGKDGQVSIAYVLPECTLRYMNSNPKSVMRSAMFGDTEVDVDMSSLRDGLNLVIRNDKTNELRLRGYPTKERRKTTPESEPHVIHITEDAEPR
ncbi:uncharacterized protein FIBRA_00255 [Fibroporia radiculosa]|uniref:DUF8205 domain-containing protein n=1 Tax=Fibroporia radiculosa TaxID=599839 RepID=J7SBZ4_9APHY|nr:uncharacterized protein FIBRA_00255 [Fibroporia radiculosa]CCL98261.1 predicted protein [Fibroporia radiculosa]